MMPRFRPDNTPGYSDECLGELNDAFDKIIANSADLWANDTSPERDASFKSWQDHVAETLLARYHQGIRGEELITSWRGVV